MLLLLIANYVRTEGEDQIAVPVVRCYLHDELDLGYSYSRFRQQRYTRRKARAPTVS